MWTWIGPSNRYERILFFYVVREYSKTICSNIKIFTMKLFTNIRGKNRKYSHCLFAKKIPRWSVCLNKENHCSSKTLETKQYLMNRLYIVLVKKNDKKLVSSCHHIIVYYINFHSHHNVHLHISRFTVLFSWNLPLEKLIRWFADHILSHRQKEILDNFPVIC